LSAKKKEDTLKNVSTVTRKVNGVQNNNGCHWFPHMDKTGFTLFGWSL